MEGGRERDSEGVGAGKNGGRRVAGAWFQDLGFGFSATNFQDFVLLTEGFGCWVRFKVLGVGVTVRFLGLMQMPYLRAAVQQVTAECLVHRTLNGGSFRTLILMLKKEQSLLSG